MLALFLNAPKTSESPENRGLTPPLQETPANIRINLILPETRVIGLHLRCWQYGSIFIQIFVVGSERSMCFETQCVTALHPRLLILTPIESAYATPYWSSIVTSVLSCPFSDIWQFSAEKSDPTVYHPNFGVVPLGLDYRCWSSEDIDPKLIIRVITFELTQHIRPRYINVTDRQTDGQTDRQSDGQLTIATAR